MAVVEGWSRVLLDGVVLRRIWITIPMDAIKTVIIEKQLEILDISLLCFNNSVLLFDSILFLEILPEDGTVGTASRTSMK